MLENEPPDSVKTDGELLEKPKGQVSTDPLPNGEATQTVEIPGPAMQAIMQVAASQFLHQGPIPDAQSFEKYERTVKGAGDRILRMAEKEQYFRLERAPIDSKREFCGRLMGQAIGFLSLMAIVGIGSYIALNATSDGQITFACMLIATPVLAALEKATDFFRDK